jgi:hypothetical protein
MSNPANMDVFGSSHQGWLVSGEQKMAVWMPGLPRVVARTASQSTSESGSEGAAKSAVSSDGTSESVLMIQPLHV